MLCHDPKFNEYVSAVVEVENEPTEQEVWTLLEPAANETMEKHQAAGEHYELNSITITKL